MHSGLADPCDRPKCGRLDCVIFSYRGLRSRYPRPITTKSTINKNKKTFIIVVIISTFIHESKDNDRISELCITPTTFFIVNSIFLYYFSDKHKFQFMNLKQQQQENKNNNNQTNDNKKRTKNTTKEKVQVHRGGGGCSDMHKCLNFFLKIGIRAY